MNQTQIQTKRFTPIFLIVILLTFSISAQENSEELTEKAIGQTEEIIKEETQIEESNKEITSEQISQIEDSENNHEGQRIKKTTYNIDSNKNNLSSYYINSRPADFIHNRITNGTIYNETYIYLYDKLIARIDNDNRKFFYHPDHLGSTTLVTNESGAVVENISYLPFV